jgi:hypothetical protein
MEEDDEVEERIPKALLRIKLKKLSNVEKLTAEVLKVFSTDQINEFFRCIMKEVDKLDEKNRHPSGGVSFAVATYLYLHWLLYFPPMATYATNYDFSASSMTRLTHQFTYLVSNTNKVKVI